MAPLLDRVLDASVLFSFDRSGFERHRRAFDPRDLEVDLTGRRVLVTGASGGLGLAASTALAGLGAEVLLLCRDRGRGEAAVDRIRAAHPAARLRLVLADVARLASIREAVEALALERLDVLINNAGVLPLARQETDEGHELTFATNLLGPFALTEALLPALRAAPAGRVVTVTSGGMYPVRLSLDDVEWRRRPFDGVRAYAETKRAEVVLTELWAQRERDTRVVFSAMHPGWADTAGVRGSLPGFSRVMEGRLRSAEEGADTIVWLAAAERAREASGALWFDRARAPAHVLPWTRERPAERARLWALLEAVAGLSPRGS